MSHDDRHWAGPDEELGRYISASAEKTLLAYGNDPDLIEEHANQEQHTAHGGYAGRQLVELVQNAADALAGGSGGRGRIAIRVDDSFLYCADDGKPIDKPGVRALRFSYMSRKTGIDEIGRFGLGFKSLLGVSSAPEFFSVAASFRFDPEHARKRIQLVAPGAVKLPTLRLPAPLDPQVCRDGDPVLDQLMGWASNIVRLPLKPDAIPNVTTQVLDFPKEFLLFVEHVRSLTLSESTMRSSRRIEVRRRGEDHTLVEVGRQTTRWRVFSRSHPLSDKARTDNRALDDEKRVIQWAAPVGKTRDRRESGYFWAFFPTMTASLVSGILNAHWKTNEDRKNLLPGPYNDELIAAAADLIAQNIHKLSTDDDPATHLDALPRRKAPGDSEQSGALRDKLFSKLSRRPVVPDQRGTLLNLKAIKYPPRELTTGGRALERAPFQRWSEYRGRPSNWLHPHAISPARLAKIDELFKALQPWRPSPLVAPRATIAQWLGALVNDCPRLEVARASMAAVQAAAAIPRRARPRKPAEFGPIVLAANGELRTPDPEGIFLANPEHGIADAPIRKSEVHPDLAKDFLTRNALRELGITTASPISRFSAFVEGIVEHFTGANMYPPGIWGAFWKQSRRLAVSDVLEILKRKGQGKVPFVHTLAGTWSPPAFVLLPGAIVEGTGERDARVTVDMRYHTDDVELLRGLGVWAGPQVNRDLSMEPWFRVYRNTKRSEFRRQALEAVGAKPNENLLAFDRERGSGPLHILARLSPQSAALYTDALLDLASTYEPWIMRHKTQTRYPPLEFESPTLDHLRHYGWVDTVDGPVPLDDALGPRPKSKAALYALLAHPKADKIKNAFELAEPQPVFTGLGDPVPLVDVWPGLREHLRDDQEHISLCRCDHIGVGGQGRKCVLYGGDLYLATRVEEEEKQLRLVVDRLAIKLSRHQQQRILQKQSEQAIRQHRVAVQQASTDAQRLLNAVGPGNLRVGLGNSVLAILESEDGPLDGVQLAEAVIATHHTDSLRQFRWALDHLDPPRQWAGSSAAVKFVQSLGFSSEWAGQRGTRRDAYIQVRGPFQLPALHGYQRTIVARIRSLLRNGVEIDAKRRGMVSLPTGSGKTRVAVQALVESIREDGFPGGILWVADREELCEQAVESWAQVWASIGGPGDLRISRMWGGHRNPQRNVGPHIVIATIQTLNARFKARNPTGDSFLSDMELVVFDEAHRSVAPTFTSVMDELGLTHMQRSREPFVIGLTATPYRGYNEAETAWLARRYARNRLDEEAFAKSDAEYVVNELQDDQVLAKVDHRTIEGAQFTLADHEVDRMAEVPWLPRSAEERLAHDADRTGRILEAYEEHVPRDWPALVFATSVEHAGVLAALLNARGVRARAVSGQTEMSTRRRIVESFRSGELQALVNYAVFREGFDAPRTRAIVVARPVYSPNLYFQMIGRGMRGTKNGGNERCLVLNVRDNILNFNRALAFAELDWLWAKRE